ncbi:MAG: hypothetical protein Q8P52_00455, partial [bacterium]|nr:hypothetical protein [bacterium]
MKEFWKKTIAAVLLVSIIAPSILLLRPERSEALVDCLAGLAELGGLLGAANSAVSVPVGDAGNLAANTQTSVQQTGATIKECALDFLVNNLANTLIRNFTRSVVNWINNGFNGSPAFVTNPEGFFGNVADEVLGQEIYGLGAIGEFICSPFDFDIRIALGLSFGTRGRDEVVCRLSDVQKNFHRAFVGGNFGGQAGWQNWFDLNYYPQNNPYSTYLQASAGIRASIVNAQGREINLLGQGRGFLPFRKCIRYSESVPTAVGRQKSCEEYEIRTPGTVIENTLNDHLGSETRRLEVADEINEIIGALVNQAVTQIFSGAGGLLGSSRASQNGNNSYLGRLASGDVVADYNQSLNLANATLPFGISLTCDEYWNNNYTTTSDGLVEVYVGTSDPMHDGAARHLNSRGEKIAYFTPQYKNDRTQWTSDDLLSVEAYCANQIVDGHASGFTSDDLLFDPNSFGFEDEPSFSAEGAIRERNVAQGKVTRQSSIYTGGSYIRSSRNAVDGNILGNDNFGLSLTQKGSREWWQVDLRDPKKGVTDWEISQIRVYGSGVRGYTISSQGLFKVYLTTADPESMSYAELEAADDIVVFEAQGRLNPDQGEEFVQFDLPKVGGSYPIGSYVRVSQMAGSGTDWLGIAEVQVLTPENSSGQTAPKNTGPAISINPSA